jgi:hypothetical protein
MPKINDDLMNSTALPEVFDPETQEGSQFDVLPVGEYVAQVIDASVSAHKNGDGYGISLTWQISEGDYENRCAFQHITFLHSSAQAQQIGRRQLKDLSVATGVNEHVNDVEVFKFIPCRIRLGVEKDPNGVYADKNRVSRVLPLNPPEEPGGGGRPAKPMAPKPGPKPEPPKTPPQAAKTDPAQQNTRPWREPPKTTQEELKDAIPY